MDNTMLHEQVEDCRETGEQEPGSGDLWTVIIELAKAQIADPALHEYLQEPTHPPVQEGILSDFVWAPLYWHLPDCMPVLIFPEPDMPVMDRSGQWQRPTGVRFYPSTAERYGNHVVPMALGPGCRSAEDAQAVSYREMQALSGLRFAGDRWE